VLVTHPSLTVRSMAELITLAKQTPDELVYASGGRGTPHHLCAELLKSMSGIRMRPVHYKGTAPALNDVVAGHVPLMFSDPVPALPFIREGKVRALGVSTKSRVPPAPDIPPIAEAGFPDFDAMAWTMIVAQARTPKQIVNRLHAELKGIVEPARNPTAADRSRHDPRQQSAARRAAGIHQHGDRALGQDRAPSRPCRIGVAT
jgi:tripartite-type tricarboxylate transporter receptor subunit TctC